MRRTRAFLTALTLGSLAVLAVPFAAPATAEAPATYDIGPVQPQLQSLVDEVAPMFGVTTVYGYRASAVDPGGHPAGLAADFMVDDPAQGDQIAQYLIDNADRLDVDYILWQQRIWLADNPDLGWQPMEDRGSPTANHMDHVHVNVKPLGPVGVARATVTVDTFSSSKTGSHTVGGAILNHYEALDGPSGLLGYPITDERATPQLFGAFNHFQRGSIYWSPGTGAHSVIGQIRVRWAKLGWENSTLGFPVTDEFTIPGGRGQDFQFGSIRWTPGGGAVVVG